MDVVGWEETAGESLVGVIMGNLKAGGGSEAEIQMRMLQAFKTKSLDQQSQSDVLKQEAAAELEEQENR